ncbi:putative 3,4-dihydroxy-2-butanone kinase isoform X5 [Cucumis melo var. makuwa]|uniref:Putative 3,4-dihydroxy-2-butanone kinase isoform X5 n=1 Tax=Cucumis melo var. makuwa TaxID=1194695 RepID=A0A5D3BI91_CUCMM|nr:putative 3,4-dihydroxy-2-butanone kinase isoform X5 [Cucumis melo var. makuwa]
MLHSSQQIQNGPSMSEALHGKPTYFLSGKVAGAAAAAGLSLLDVATEAKHAAEMIGTMGVALSVCTLPGQVTSDRLGPGKMELGLGIHGEPGAAVADLQPVDVIVSHVLKQILSPLGFSADLSVNSQNTTWRISVDNHFRKFRDIDKGRLRISKFQAKSGWILSCDHWPYSGGLFNIRVCLGKDQQGKWQTWGNFHLKIERWDNLKHSWPLVQKGYGGWLKIKNLPLDYWCRSTLEVIGDHFRGLTDIAFETLNLTNVSEARIQVKKNLCGFVPSTIEITDLKCRNIYLHFGDFEFLNPTGPSKVPSL